jgi:protein-tyrosine phosphatase
MIDIHSHILPGLDDGAHDLSESIAMLRMAADSGTTDIVATPHANYQYRYDGEAVVAKVAELSQAVGEKIRIHRGCDFHLSAANIMDALANPTKYTINNLSYLLVEFAEMVIPPNIEAVFARFRGLGITPIITHPERNPVLQKRPAQVEKWVNAGCLVQVTAQSFGSRFGKSAQRCCQELMQSRVVHIVASDAHDTRHRPPVLADAFEHVRGKYGEGTAENLFIRNPGSVLAGEPVL